MTASSRPPAWGNPVAFFPRLTVPLGGRNAALLFCQLHYWQQRCCSAHGVYKSAEDIYQETGLTYREQGRARRALVARGVLEEHYDRPSHRLYFRVNETAASALLTPLPPLEETADTAPPDEHMTIGQIPPEAPDHRSDGTLPTVSSHLTDGQVDLLTKNTQEITHRTLVDSAELARAAEVAQVFAYWRRVMGHPGAKLTKGRRDKINARLTEGYAPDQLCAAIDGCRASAFHMGDNRQRRRYDSIDLILRNGEKLEEFIALRRPVNGGGGERSALGRFLDGEDLDGQDDVIEGETV